MIVSFRDRATADVFHGENTREARRLPGSLWGIIRRKLDMLNAANRLDDLRSPPGNHLEKLQGGRHSIRVNKQYQIVFKHQETARFTEVQCTDYH